MSDAIALAERREQILGELAEWMHAAAHEAQRRLLEAETTDDFAKLAGSLAKLGRGVRQSILMQRKLEAERLAGERKAEPVDTSEIVARHIRRVRLRTQITRHAADELDDDVEAELFHDDLNARLDELERTETFLDTPIEVLVAQLCADLGVEPPELPHPPASPDPAGSAGGEPPAAERVVEGASPTQGVGQALHSPNTS